MKEEQTGVPSAARFVLDVLNTAQYLAVRVNGGGKNGGSVILVCLVYIRFLLSRYNKCFIESFPVVRCDLFVIRLPMFVREKYAKAYDIYARKIC